MSRISYASKKGLIFEITSARINEEDHGKKYVVYTLQVQYISETEDTAPSVIERRYTQFENLYNTLKKYFPVKMAAVPFPKKILTGNFDNNLICARSTAFENFLRHVSGESALRTSKTLLRFLQAPELSHAKKLFEVKEYEEACKKLQNIFKLNSKIFSDRSPAVLMPLCRMILYYSETPILTDTESIKWADLSLYRFDGVSDIDLLELYIPHLHACIKIYQKNNQSVDHLNEKLENCFKMGMNHVSKRTNLREVLDRVEKRII